MIKTWLAGLFALAITAPALAQTPPPPRRLPNEWPPIATPSLSRMAGWAGPARSCSAAPWRTAQFFMVGEQHGTATIAEISAALHRRGGRHRLQSCRDGDRPHSGVEVERLDHDRDPAGSPRNSARPHTSFAVAFLFWAEEGALAEQFVALSPAARRRDLGPGPGVCRRLALAAAPARGAGADAGAARGARDFADPRRSGADGAWVDAGGGSRTAAAGLRLRRRSGRRGDGRGPDPQQRASTRPFTGRGGSGLEANLTARNLYEAQFPPPLRGGRARRGPAAARLPEVRRQPRDARLLHDQRAVARQFHRGMGAFARLRRGEYLHRLRRGEQNDPRSGANSPCESELPADSPLRTMMLDAPLTLFDLRPLRSAAPGRQSGPADPPDHPRLRFLSAGAQSARRQRRSLRRARQEKRRPPKRPPLFRLRSCGDDPGFQPSAASALAALAASSWRVSRRSAMRAALPVRPRR